MWTHQSSSLEQASSSRIPGSTVSTGPGWGGLPPTCPPSTLNKRRHFPPRPQLRPAFSLLSFRCVQPGCVLTPEYFWGQEVAGAENSSISSENDPGPREGKKEKNLFI